MDNSELIQSLNKELQVSLSAKASYDEIRTQLSEQVNYLIQSDFQRLVVLLYRIDISETKLKTLLKENPDQDAGNIIAELIIERQLQKIKSRQQFSQRDKNIDENEKW